MTNYKIKKNAAIYKSINFFTCIKQISLVKSLSIPTKFLLILSLLPTKTLLISKVYNNKATYIFRLAKNIFSNIASNLKFAQIEKIQDRLLIKLLLKSILMLSKSFQNPESVCIVENGNDITLSNIYIESELQERQNQADINDININPEDKIESEEENVYEIKKRDEYILQAKFKATYNITYKAEFKYKKKLSISSIVCKKHDNSFDLDIHLMKW